MANSDDFHDDRRNKTGFLILVSGARSEVLARCPTERIKFQTLGWVILITCGMATVSMWFALTSALGFNAIFSLPLALLWGLIIMGIDRWLVTSMPLDGKRKLVLALPRLALALLLGSLISTPIVLRVFESEINNQVSIIKENNEAQFLTSQQNSSIQTRVAKWQKTVTNLEQVIDSRGAEAINPANDAEVQGLTTQLSSERTVAASDYKAWQCQLYGGCGSPKGSGPLAAASQKRYEADEAQITNLTGEIQTREQALQANDTNSQANRLQQAQSSLPAAKAQLSAAQAEENSLLSNFQGTNSSTNGLLIRLKALDQLSAGNSTLQAARILLFLLFLTIELLPVTVKLLQRQGNYEKILLQEMEIELAQADWELRGGFEPTGTFRPTGVPQPGQANDKTAEWPPSPRRRDDRQADLAAVWQEHSRSTPPDYEPDSPAPDEYTPSVDADTTGPYPMDDKLRDMPDTRVMSNYEERQGGIERRYGDEDF
jgi:hypothetical protein